MVPRLAASIGIAATMISSRLISKAARVAIVHGGGHCGIRRVITGDGLDGPVESQLMRTMFVP